MRGRRMVPVAAAVLLMASTARAQDASADADAGVVEVPDAGPAQPDAGAGPEGESEPAPDPGPEASAAESGPTRVADAPAPSSPPAWATPPPEPRVLPLRFAARPLTLPRGAVRIDATFGITSQERPALDRQSYVSFQGVAGFGATDDIEIGVIALPIQISPDPLFLDPGIYGLFRLVRTERLDLGLQVEATVPVRAESAFGNALSIRALWRAASFLRVDAAATLVALYQDPVETSLRFPVLASFHVSETLFVGVQSGLDVEYLSGADERAGRKQNAFIPFGVFLGGTLVGDRGPTGDLRIGVLLPSVTDGFDLWQLGFGGSFYVL